MDGENNGKPYENGWFGGMFPTIFGNIHVFLMPFVASDFSEGDSEMYRFALGGDQFLGRFFGKELWKWLLSTVSCILPFIPGSLNGGFPKMVGKPYPPPFHIPKLIDHLLVGKPHGFVGVSPTTI